MKRILFLYIAISSGHQRAAEAVMGAVTRLTPRVKPIGIDSFTHAYPVLGRLLARTYLEMLKYTPQIWEYLYDNPRVAVATREIREALNIMNAGKLLRLYTKHRPRAFVCTQALPMTVLAALKRRGKIRAPIVGVVTDYDVHSYWLSRHVDLYLVATEEIKRKLVREGIREGRVLVTGIPVDPHFALAGDKSAERARLGLHAHRPTVLVMGGSRGLGPLGDIVARLRALPLSPQVIAVCGDNRPVFNELTRRFGHDRSVRVFGFTRSMPRLMDAADLLVSKPGGLTCAESMAKGLPLVMVRPIPGQEERNAAYMLRHNAAERVEDMKELAAVVERLLTHPERLHRLRDRALELSKPRAAFDAAEAVLKLVKEPVLHASAEPHERPRAAVA
jgi:processive 1,2-diacylglycerol beta-glucosyltransferase